MRFHSQSELAQWARQAGYLWLFLDYDGTLADFAPTPDQIEPNPRIIGLLEKLAHQSAIRITVLSGRRLQDLRLLVPVAGIFLAGTYGIELMAPSGEIIHRSKYEDVRPFLEKVKPQWEQLICGKKGFFLEDKSWTLAIHARFADDQEAEQVISEAKKIAQTNLLPDTFRLLGGHRFLEIAPRAANKGETVTYLLKQHPFPGARLLYFGDDDKDEEAFLVIHANQGVAVKVRQPSQASQSTTADFYFESPAQTLDWLQELI